MVDTVLATTLDVLSHSPAGLITDIDGTISALAPTPTEAFVAPEIKASLERLARRLALVAVVSGRSATNARAMVGVEGIVYVGNHGFERLDDGEIRRHPVVEQYRPQLARALDRVRAAIGDWPGILVEDKISSASIHYRLTPNPEEAERRVRALAGEVAGDLTITTGKMVVELRPPVTINKGTAIDELLRECALRGAVFVGDDVTDVDAFRALQRAGELGAVRELRLAVATRETPAIVLEAAHHAIDGVGSVDVLLSNLADRLEERP